MATINTGRATRTLTDGGFWTTAVLVVAGSGAALLLSDWARSNAIDLDMTGDEVLYAGLGAFTTLAVLPRNLSYGLALGMVAGGASVAFDEIGLI